MTSIMLPYFYPRYILLECINIDMQQEKYAKAKNKHTINPL